jgi:hypothetical protein
MLFCTVKLNCDLIAISKHARKKEKKEECQKGIYARSLSAAVLYSCAGLRRDSSGIMLSACRQCVLSLSVLALVLVLANTATVSS